MEHKIEKFRDGMFEAPSRTYGESYMEPIIRTICKLFESDTSENDAENDNGEAEEIKCTKVLRTKPKGKSLVERIILESENNVLSRLISFDDCYTEKYDANIQNVSDNQTVGGTMPTDRNLNVAEGLVSNMLGRKVRFADVPNTSSSSSSSSNVDVDFWDNIER